MGPHSYSGLEQAKKSTLQADHAGQSIPGYSQATIKDRLDKQIASLEERLSELRCCRMRLANASSLMQLTPQDLHIITHQI